MSLTKEQKERLCCIQCGSKNLDFMNDDETRDKSGQDIERDTTNYVCRNCGRAHIYIHPNS